MVRPQTYLTINLPNRDQVGINSGSIQSFGVDSGLIRGRFGVDSASNGRTAGRPITAARPDGRSAEWPFGPFGRMAELPKIRYVKGVTVGFKKIGIERQITRFEGVAFFEQ